MSKERELLNRVAVTLKVREICPLLLKEISELLNEPEQEEWSNFTEDAYNNLKVLKDTPVGTKIYTAPPTRESLSDEEVFDIGYKAGFAIDQDYEVDNYGFLNGDGYVDNEPYFKLVREIEKAHGIGGDDEH